VGEKGGLREAKLMLDALPKRKREGTTRKKVLAWLAEEVPVPRPLKAAYYQYVDEHFKTEKTRKKKKKMMADRITWLSIYANNGIAKEKHLAQMVELPDGFCPTGRTLSRLKKYREQASTKNVHKIEVTSPLIDTIDKMLDFYGYERISPRLRTIFFRLFNYKCENVSQTEYLNLIGDHLHIQKVVYSYYRAINNESKAEVIFDASYAEYLFPVMDIMGFDAIVLKSKLSS
jgi:hypothetical protein